MRLKIAVSLVRSRPWAPFLKINHISMLERSSRSPSEAPRADWGAPGVAQHVLTLPTSFHSIFIPHSIVRLALLSRHDFPTTLWLRGHHVHAGIGCRCECRPPALAEGMSCRITASGFFVASHTLEICRVGGIRLLRTQSSSCIVHCSAPVVCGAHIGSGVRIYIDAKRQPVAPGRRTMWIDASALPGIAWAAAGPAPTRYEV